MIYIDEMLLLNFIIDYVILNTLTFLLKKNVKRRRIYLSCLVGEISILYLFISFNTLLLLLFKFILGLIMIIILYGYTDIKSFIKEIVYFYILCLMVFLLYVLFPQFLKFFYYILLSYN